MTESVLHLDDFAQLCGTTLDEFPEAAVSIASSRDFRYRRLTGAERDAQLCQIVRRIIDGDMWVSGPDKQHIWDGGWSENLEEYRRTRSLDALAPKFLRPQVLRLFGDYVDPVSPRFEFDVVDVFRHWLFSRYLNKVSGIYEFGCGSAQHMPVYAKLFSGIPVTGLDWSPVSSEIISLLAADYGWPLSARRFDFFKPDCDFTLASGAGVVTVGALEQLGSNFGAFLGYLLEQKPAVVINVETITEMYDPDNLVDYLALAYDRRRGYLTGWLTTLRELEQQGVVRILRSFKTQIGGRFHDSYCTVVWTPA